MTAIYLLAGIGAGLCLLAIGAVLFAVGCSGCSIVVAVRERR